MFLPCIIAWFSVLCLVAFIIIIFIVLVVLFELFNTNLQLVDVFVDLLDCLVSLHKTSKHDIRHVTITNCEHLGVV